MVFKIGVAIQKKKFLLSMRSTKFQKMFKCIKKCVFIYHQFVKKKIDLFQKNVAEKFSVL